MSQSPFIEGFLTKCAEVGLSREEAVGLLKASGFWEWLGKMHGKGKAAKVMPGRGSIGGARVGETPTPQQARNVAFNRGFRADRGVGR